MHYECKKVKNNFIMKSSESRLITVRGARYKDICRFLLPQCGSDTSHAVNPLMIFKINDVAASCVLYPKGNMEFFG
jgi:hypothetical protein